MQIPYISRGCRKLLFTSETCLSFLLTVSCLEQNFLFNALGIGETRVSNVISNPEIILSNIYGKMEIDFHYIEFATNFYNRFEQNISSRSLNQLYCTAVSMSKHSENFREYFCLVESCSIRGQKPKEIYKVYLAHAKRNSTIFRTKQKQICQILGNYIIKHELLLFGSTWPHLLFSNDFRIPVLPN